MAENFQSTSEKKNSIKLLKKKKKEKES